MAQLSYDIAGYQIDGARDYQEDAFLITHLSNVEDDQQALIIVADGMGGHAAGNVASNMAVQAFNKHVSSNYPVSDATLIPDILRASVVKANEGIKETVQETAALAGMGCTMVGILLADGKVWWASVGDSHLYIIRDNEMKKLNADHSYGGFLDRMAAEGKQIDIDPSLSRNMLMSALTGTDIAEIDVSREPFILQPNDILLVASDGMDTLPNENFPEIAASADNSRDIATALIKAVQDIQRPRQDNTTVVCIRTALIEPKNVAPVMDYSDDQDTYDDTPDSRGGGFGKIAAILVVAAAILLGADFALKLGIVFPGAKAPVTTVAGNQSASTAEDEPAPAADDTDQDRPARDSAEATADTTAPDEPAAQQTAARETAPAQAKPARKRPHLVVPFTDKFKDGTSGPIMVSIPAGSYEMGAGSLSTALDARPKHKVTLKKFSISQYEITFAEYERFAKAMGRSAPERSGINPQTYPVSGVSWQDAQDYTAWLSQRTGKKYQLPTESQWEYAARAGTKYDFWWGHEPGNNNAHCLGCGSPANVRTSAPVGLFAPNPWGLYDTSGNVAEWTQDCYNPNYNGAPTDGSAWHDGDCSMRVVRGGSFSNSGNGSSNVKRSKYKAGSRLTHIGFRVVRED